MKTTKEKYEENPVSTKLSSVSYSEIRQWIRDNKSLAIELLEQAIPARHVGICTELGELVGWNEYGKPRFRTAEGHASYSLSQLATAQVMSERYVRTVGTRGRSQTRHPQVPRLYPLIIPSCMPCIKTDKDYIFNIKIN